MDRVGLVFLLCLALAVVVSFFTPVQAAQSELELTDIDFKTSRGFNASFGLVVLILMLFYSVWW